MKIRGTDFVVYQVSDLARAAGFYGEILGLPLEMFSKAWQWAEFAGGNATLALHGGNQLPGTISGGRIALAGDDVSAAGAELKQRGVRVVREPRDYSVCWAMEILDPDGNPMILHKRAEGTFGNKNGQSKA